MGFPLVSKLLTFNNRERRNDDYLAFLAEFSSFVDRLRQSR